MPPKPNRKEQLRHFLPDHDDFALDRLDEQVAQNDARLEQLQKVLTEKEFNELLLGRAASALGRATLIPQAFNAQGMQTITVVYAQRLRVCLEQYL